ncbi:hypothetical protein J3R83DRAFT_4671 [Lanmaoa asiatica]|nr:hypothetical protein J3R83DRAFT_4671 [Lanmaoa asiatica]
MRKHARSPETFDTDSSDSRSSRSEESGLLRAQQVAKQNKKHPKGSPRKTQKHRSHRSSASAPHAKNDSDASESDSKPEANTRSTEKEYAVAARAVARCVDIFCHPRKVVDYIILLKEEEAVKNGELEESEAERKRREALLRVIPPKQRDRYQHAYDTFIELAPAFKELVNNPKKRDELRQVLGGMKKVITSVRSDDCARLKERIGRYVPVNPAKDVISPPIHDGQSSRSHLGFNHPVLARFLCPIEHVKAYDVDPDGTRQKLLSGKIKVTSDVFPAFVWAGEPPGANFDDDSMLEGMFEGYFLERVMRHIFRGASTAFGEEPTGSRSCNAELHEMSKVVAPNIAYACLQARFNISSKSRWSEKDGAFNYRNFYYAVLDIIEDCADKEWTDSLLRFHNCVVFGDENGRGDRDSKDGSGEKGSGSSASFLARLHAQGQARAKEKASAELGDGNANNNVNSKPGGSNDNTCGANDDPGTAAITTTVRNTDASVFGTPVQAHLPPRFSSHSAGTTTGESPSTIPVSNPSRPIFATGSGSTATPSSTRRSSDVRLGGETSLSPLTGSDEWSQAIARRTRDKGKGMAR